MRITLDSPVNKYYAQTLGMIFFPGERFGDKQREEEIDEPSLYIRSEQRENGIFSYAKAEHKGKVCEAEYFAEKRTAEQMREL